MKNKAKSLVILTCLLVIFATLIASAVKPEFAGNGKGKGLEKKILKINQTYNDSENEGNKTSKGKLISTAQQVRREQFQLLKNQLKEIGYHGRVNDFTVAFNREIMKLKIQIRNKVNSSGDMNLTQRVIRETAERELARVRLEKMEQLDISETAINESLMNITGLKKPNLGQEIKAMNKNFKQMVVQIAQNGTVEEKKNLKNQINDYVKSERAEIKERKRLLKIERSGIREMLKQNKTSEEILGLIQ